MLTDQGNVNSEFPVKKTSQVLFALKRNMEQKHRTLFIALPQSLLLDTALCSDREMKRQ